MRKLGPGVRVDWEKFGAEMEAKRKAAGLSMLDASIECGMASSSTWAMTAQGRRCATETFIRILWWLGGTDVRPFLLWDSKGDKGW